MKEFSKFVGLDVHKETIAVSVAEANGGEVRYLGDIANTPEAVDKLVKQQRKGGANLSFCYEAGPCGYGIHRQLTDLGWDCQVGAPSLIPKKAGNRVKTDRRDSLMLARLHRAGELTSVWVPDSAQEALRDLTRAREDMKHLQRQAKQRLLAFLLRHGKRYEGKSNWTQSHYRWLEGVKCGQAPQLMAYLGVVPSEHSSGSKQTRGGITKTGNGHVRRVLVEAAWTYRHPARKTAVLQRRAERTSEAVQEIAWKAQTRLCGGYRLFEARGKLKVQACTAIARELAGFIWAIGQALPQPAAAS